VLLAINPFAAAAAVAAAAAARLGDPELLSKVMALDPYYVTQDNGAGAPLHFAVTYRQLDMVRAAHSSVLPCCCYHSNYFMDRVQLRPRHSVCSRLL
jgi:hypothetical protein